MIMNNRIELDGIWKYKVDTTGAMLFHGLAEDFSWKNMVLPQNWYKAGLEVNGGVVWFRRRFKVPAVMAGKKLFLTFTGVDYSATVWINSSLAGEHCGYFQTFDFDITHFVVTGEENIITVRVESPYEEPQAVWPEHKKAIKGIFGHHEARPGGHSLEHGQEKNTGGIWNSVYIESRETLRIEQIKISPTLLKNGSAVLDIVCELENDTPQAQPATLKIIIGGANFESPEIVRIVRPVTLSTQSRRVRIIQTITRPHLWWCWDHGPQHLYLITAVLELHGRIMDEQTRRFGIRGIEVTAQEEWILNGRKIFIRGTNIIPTQWLSEYNREAIQRDLDLVKAAHLNALRVHAHVNREEFYAACDEAGLLVYQDFALVRKYEESDAFQEEAVHQLADMIALLHHHPAIAVWCCHTEPGSLADTLDVLLARAAREMDATRHVVAASTHHQHPYPGWSGGSLIEFIKLPGGPFPTEFGAQALPDKASLEKMLPASQLWPPQWEYWEYHNFQYSQTFHTAKIELGETLDAFVNNSQNYQYRLIKFAIETYRCARFRPISGFFQFMFVDPWPAITWSVVDYYRNPKKGYRALQLACQPVLLHLRMEQRELLCEAGEPCFTSLTIVNDLDRTFEKAALKIWLEGGAGSEMPAEVATLTIAAGSVQTLAADQRWRIPAHLEPGAYQLRAKLITSEGALLSENEETIQLVKRS
jgi:beta-mannosidase